MQWDYSALARDYERRAPYAKDTVTVLLQETGLAADAFALDVGAGTGRLAAMFAAAGLSVVAVEPNAAMRAIGVALTEGQRIDWRDAVGEDTSVATGCIDLVGYGSSFNVLDPDRALAEAARVLKPGGWMCCLWNHRDLEDPLQGEIEATIHRLLPSYSYGTRRESPAAAIEASGRFGAVRSFERRLVHRTNADDFVAGFRAHATLQRQAGARFDAVLEAIGEIVGGRSIVDVPFITRVWFAPRNPA